MNLDRVTTEFAYELIRNGVWTVAEFQEWYNFKRKEADLFQPNPEYVPDFKQIRKGSRLKIYLSDVIPDSEMVVYFGQRGEDSFDVRFEVEGYSATDMHLSGLHLQEKTKENLENAWKRIVKMAKIAVAYDLDEKSPAELHYLANVLCPVD